MRSLSIDYPNVCLVFLIRPNYFIEVPCGNCIECQKRKFRDYRMRLLYELQRYPNSIFVTLTFDNPSLSRFFNNPNQSIRLFLDRIRKKYGKQVRHWFVAEFGSKRGRLHYHGILFNIDISNDELFTLWKYGNTFVGYANDVTAKYIVKYLTKQDTKGISPPRIISSKGIGDSWLSTSESRLLYKSNSAIMWIGGNPIPIPRYYINKMYSREERDLQTYYYFMEETHDFQKYLNGRLFTDERRYNYERSQVYNSYIKQGLVFDDYVKRPIGISSQTRFRLLTNFIGKEIWEKTFQEPSHFLQI